MEQCKPQGELRARVGGPGAPATTGHPLLPLLPAVTRGDVFTMPEDDYWSYDYREETKNDTGTGVPSESTTSLHGDLKPRTEGTTKPTAFLEPEEEPSTLSPEVGQQGVRPDTTDQGTSEFPEEELCSGKPFDAFTDLKNGSVFAFRGDSVTRSDGGRICRPFICF